MSRSTTQFHNATQVSAKTYATLLKAMPGQSMAWYERIGQMIEAGLMPMPQIESPVESPVESQIESPVETTPAKRSWVSQSMGSSLTFVKPDYAAMRLAPIVPATLEVSAAVKDVVSEATQAKLIAACKTAELAERLAKAERRQPVVKKKLGKMPMIN